MCITKKTFAVLLLDVVVTHTKIEELSPDDVIPKNIRGKCLLSRKYCFIE